MGKKITYRLIKELREDEGLYLSWQANIAMAFHDEALKQKAKISRKKLLTISNQAAKNFLNLLIKK